jgi:DNA polymerase-3 subunit gamma/tau
MALFKILQAPPALAIETLIDRLDGLRQEFAGAGNTGPAPARDAGNERLQAAQPAVSAGTDAKPAAGPPPPPGDPADTWFAIRSRIAESHPSLSATLIRSTLKTVADDQIEIEVAGNGFHRNMIQREKNMEVIQSACRDVLGRPVDVKISVAEEDSDALVKKKDDDRLKAESLGHPLVADAIEIFDGKVVDVRIIKEDPV